MAENKYPETLEGFKAAYMAALPKEQPGIDPLERAFNLFIAAEWGRAAYYELSNPFIDGVDAALGMEKGAAVDKLSGGISAVNLAVSDLLKSVQIIGAAEKNPGGTPEQIPESLNYRLLSLARNLSNYGSFLASLMDAISGPADWRAKE